jgi:hypothetical protein
MIKLIDKGIAIFAEARATKLYDGGGDPAL